MPSQNASLPLSLEVPALPYFVAVGWSGHQGRRRAEITDSPLKSQGTGLNTVVEAVDTSISSNLKATSPRHYTVSPRIASNATGLPSKRADTFTSGPLGLVMFRAEALVCKRLHSQWRCMVSIFPDRHVAAQAEAINRCWLRRSHRYKNHSQFWIQQPTPSRFKYLRFNLSFDC